MHNTVKKDGYDYSFSPQSCQNCQANCCRGDRGYIWVYSQKVAQIASYLDISNEEFVKSYLKVVKNRYSLKEIKLAENEYACIFLDTKLNRCKIYPVRPIQCVTFPFWDYYKGNEKELREECPGIF